MLKGFKEEVKVSKNTLKSILNILKREVELQKYETVILDDIAVLEEILNYNKWDDIYEKVNNIKFKTWPSDKKIVSETKDKAKQARDRIKKNIISASKIFTFDSKQALEDIDSMYETMKFIGELVLLFIFKFKQAKKEKNIIDFNDIEHLALQLLLKEDEYGQYSPTEIAKSYQEKFQEIAIDEYQDSNLIQEQILTSISKGNNIFMVGDIKQSIYKFRHARPELFAEKYDNYGKNNIQLYDNFRSKEDILSLTNEIFKTIMTKELGDVDYNKQEFLRQGSNYPKLQDYKKALTKPELHIINLKIAEEAEEFIENVEVEAKFVANKVREIVEGNYHVYDKRCGYRKATFKDFVILLRTTANIAPIYEKELSNLEYPVFTDTGTNYFEELEVQTVLALLKIIDNPNNDINLVSVLRSPIGGFTDNDLTRIRIQSKAKSFYEALLETKNTEDENLKEKTNIFLNMLEDFREKQEYLNLDELIWYIYEETDFYNYVSLMPNGNIKTANLKMLFEKAKDYEQGSFKGLYNFINFIDRLHKTSSDMGAPKMIGENDNVIRIMSIHKSKGLEFPIVFLCGAGKHFNFQDLNEKVLLHQDLGFGMQYINYERKIEYSTLSKEAIKAKMKEEILSEEMRLLYVALTRSREKLIITGTEKDLLKSLDNKKELLGIRNSTNEKIDRAILKKAKSYLDWLEMVDMFNINFKNKIDIKYHDVTNIIKQPNQQHKAISILKDGVKADFSDRIAKLLNFEYKYKILTEIEGKSSVTKIAKGKVIADELMLKQPKFLENKKKLSKAEIGTIIHLILQKLDFNKDYTEDLIKELLEELIFKNIITEQEKQVVDINTILEFTRTKLFKRIRTAKKVYKEQPFYINIPICDLYQTTLKENILVQGIIDLFFIDKDDRIVLVDYKTDYVKTGKIELINKYKKQLELYKKTIENSTGKAVDEVYIYSTYLNEEINLD